MAAAVGQEIQRPDGNSSCLHSGARRISDPGAHRGAAHSQTRPRRHL